MTLELTVLHNIPNNAEIVKVSTTSFSTNGFLKCNLDVINVFAIPDLAEEDVGKSHRHHIFNHFFTQIMINTIDLIIKRVIKDQLLSLNFFVMYRLY